MHGEWVQWPSQNERAKQMQPVWICIGKCADIWRHTSEKFPPEWLPLGPAGCRAVWGADTGAKFKIYPIRAPHTALQPLQMVAGHLNVPTLCRIQLKNIDSRGEILWTIAPPLWFQFKKCNETTNCHLLPELFNVDTLYGFFVQHPILFRILSCFLFAEVGCSGSVWLIAAQVNSSECKLALEGFNFLGSTATSPPPSPPCWRSSAGIRVRIKLNHRPKCPECCPLDI